MRQGEEEDPRKEQDEEEKERKEKLNLDIWDITVLLLVLG